MYNFSSFSILLVSSPLLLAIGIILVRQYIILTTCLFRLRFSKLLMEIFALLFSALTFLFSFYNNVLSKTTVKKNETFFTYPIYQLRRNHTDFLQNVSLNNVIKSDSIEKVLRRDTNYYKFSFLIDKTESGNDMAYNSLKAILLDSITLNSTKTLFFEKNKDKFQISDLIFLQLNSALDSIDSSIISHVALYEGEFNDDQSPKFSFVDLGGNDGIDNYLSKIKIPNGKEKTNIAQLFSVIEKRKYIDIKKKVNVITIISDFEHEKVTSKMSNVRKEVETLISKYGQSTHLVFNLISLEGTNNNKEEIEEAKDIISTATHFIYAYKFNQDDLVTSFNNNISKYVMQIPINDTLQEITLYFPFKLERFNQVNSAKIQFDNISNPINLFVNIKAESVSENKIYFQVNDFPLKELYFLLENPQLVHFDLHQELKFQLESTSSPRNLFLEVSKPNSIIKFRIPILIKEYLSDFACYSIIILFTLFLIIITFLTGFHYYLSIFKCAMVRKQKCCKWMNEISVLIPVFFALFCVMYISRIYNTLCMKNSDFKYFLIILALMLILFVIFLCIFWYSEVKGIKDKCHEMHSKQNFQIK